MLPESNTGPQRVKGDSGRAGHLSFFGHKLENNDKNIILKGFLYL